MASPTFYEINPHLESRIKGAVKEAIKVELQGFNSMNSNLQRIADSVERAEKKMGESIPYKILLIILGAMAIILAAHYGVTLALKDFYSV